MKFIKKHWLLWLSLLVVLPAIWPLLRADFFRMHDWTHVARLVELDMAFKLGQLPPRWAPDLGWGYGMPLFHFYPPLPYYLAELLYLIKVPAVWAIKFVFGLNFLAGFYFMYLWAKEFWGKLGAFVAAAAFVYVPYRAVQFYVRGSLAELTAMTFLPLFFYAAFKLNQTRRTPYLMLTALAIAAIFLSHNVIALFAVFFIVGYFLLHLKSWSWWLLASLLALGLSSFFILPAFLEKDFTIVNQLTGGYSHYSFHFIYLRQLFSRVWAYGGSILGPKDDISFQLGWPHLLLVLPAGLVWLKKPKNLTRELSFIFFSFLVAIFMMTFHSQVIWQRLSILHLAQFPWRLLSYAATFVAILSGSIGYFLKDSRLDKIFATIVILIIIGLNLNYFRPEKFSATEDFYYTDRQRIATEMSDVLFDYLPVTAIRPEQPSDKLFNFDQLDFTAQGPGDYIVNQYYFPGWQAKIDNQPVKIEPDSNLGRIKIDLPPGEHRVEIKLGKTDIQHWSDIISLFSWSLVLSWFIYHYGQKYFRTRT